MSRTKTLGIGRYRVIDTDGTPGAPAIGTRIDVTIPKLVNVKFAGHEHWIDWDGIFVRLAKGKSIRTDLRCVCGAYKFPHKRGGKCQLVSDSDK